MNEEIPAPSTKQKTDTAHWRAVVAKFQTPSTPRATWQIVNTVGPLALCWYLMYLALPVSYWLVVPLVILAGLLVVRTFIIFHDCGHGSFLKSRKANDIIGYITGVLTLTPYYHWRWEHSVHHSNSGDLDNRGTGDVWTMTVEEYIKSSRWRRFAYKLSRNPFILFGIAPLYLFIVHQRIPNKKASPRERASVHWMNAGIVALGAVMSMIFGLGTYLLLHTCVVLVAGTVGVWMFYVQHQFEDVYWERGHEWDFTAAALQGSSYYKLPRILQWFSGNIGFHHIHHLSPRIPNYNLERCHDSEPLFHNVKPITLISSLKSLSLRLWDEQQKKMVGYRRMREVRREQRERQHGEPAQ